MTDKLLFKEETYKVIGACIKVHKNLGNGFAADVYKEALQKELIRNNVPFEKEKEINVFYDGLKLNNFYLTDFVCYENILVEICTLESIPEDIHRKSVNVLIATNYQLSLLINFGETSLKWKRFVNTN